MNAHSHGDKRSDIRQGPAANFPRNVSIRPNTVDAVSPYIGNLSVRNSGEIVHLRRSGRYTKGRDKPLDYPRIGIDVPGFPAAPWSGSPRSCPAQAPSPVPHIDG